MAKTFLVFVVSHLVLLLSGIFLISSVGTHKWYLIIWSIYLMYSAVLRLAPKAEWLDEPGVHNIIFCTLGYVLIYFLDISAAIQTWSLVSTVTVFLLYVLHENLAAADDYILFGSFSTKVDEQGIRKINNRLSLLYVGGLSVVLGIFSLFRAKALWQTVRELLKSILSEIIRLLLKLMPAVPEDQATEPDKITNTMQQMSEAQEMTSFQQSLNEILYSVMVVVIVVLILAGIGYVIVYCWRHFHRDNKELRKDGDKVIEALSFTHDTRHKRNKRFFEKLERNPAKSIRKLYKKNMKRLVAEYKLKFQYMSPEEQVQLLHKKVPDEDVIKKICSLYEKARYSEDVVTDAEVERMRSFFDLKYKQSQ